MSGRRLVWLPWFWRPISNRFSIPSKKAEPFKMWLAQVGRERIEETIDPEKTIDRALETYSKKWYVVRSLSKLFSVNYDCFIDNKLPEESNAEDTEMITQFVKNVMKLNASEKRAVFEMARIMANS